MPVTMASTSSGGAGRSRRLRQAAQGTDARCTLRIDDRIAIRLGDQVGHGFLRRLRGGRRWRRWFRQRLGRGVPQRVGHHPDGAVLGPGVLVGGGVVRLALAALGLQAQQQRARRLCLALGAGGLGGALQEVGVVGGAMRRARRRQSIA